MRGTFQGSCVQRYLAIDVTYTYSRYLAPYHR